MKKLLDISSDERRRILEMHQSATRRNYLTEAPEQASGKGMYSPFTRLIFTGKDGRNFAQVSWSNDAAQMRAYSEKLKTESESKSVRVEIPGGTYEPGEKAFASFYLLSYEIGEHAMGGKEGRISSFVFTPNPNWVKKYGEPVVTLDFSQPILGYTDSTKTNAYLGSMPVIRVNPPKQFVINYTTPTKKIDVTSDSGEKVVNIGTAVIKTNDSDNPEKTITLNVPVGTQFGVPTSAPTSAPTPATPRT
jgi:hypothetical protein